MANKPVFGITECPHCGFKLPIHWDGNFWFHCIRCGKRYEVKRQKLTDVQAAKK